MSELLTVKDLSQSLRISTRQVWKLLSAGKLPKPVRISRSVRWARESIDRWVSMGCPSADIFEAAKSSGEGRAER